MEIEEGVIRRGRRPRRITPSEISIILHMIQKPNSILTLETSEVAAILVFRTKTTQPRPQVFSVNGALTCENAAFLTSFPR